MQPINSLSTGGVDSTVITPPAHTVQTITLTDGNTALIQHTGKVLIMACYTGLEIDNDVHGTKQLLFHQLLPLA